MDNPFKGVNPYLNSELQTPGTADQPELWSSFHGDFITFLMIFLNQQLPQHYVAYSEQSLQNPKPDIGIYQRALVGQASVLEAVVIPDWEATLAEVLEPVEHYTAVVIRETTTQSKIGKTVARIELLSPSNKLGGSHAAAYRDRRIESLASSLPLIEIDLLHESPTVVPKLPVYPHEKGSYPYTVAVSDPRPNWNTVQVRVYAAVVHQPLPKVPIPLSGDDGILFDFDPPYQQNFIARRSHTLIGNYEGDPVRFETYSKADQERIRQRVQEINNQS
jgi:hypothetical protein